MSKMLVSYQGVCKMETFLGYNPRGIETPETYESNFLVDCSPNSVHKVNLEGHHMLIYSYDGFNYSTDVFDDDGTAAMYVEYDQNWCTTVTGVHLFGWTNAGIGFPPSVPTDQENQIELVDIYGDHSNNSPNNWNVYCSGTAYLGGKTRGKVVFTTTGLIVDDNSQRIWCGCTEYWDTEGPWADFYRSMFGILIDLPNGHAVPHRSYTDKYYGGELAYKPFGQPTNVGQLGAGRKRSLTIEFDSCSESEWNLIRDIFKYSRGGYPLLYMDDPDDSDTWIYGFSTKMTMEEPGHKKYFNIKLDLEEF